MSEAELRHGIMTYLGLAPNSWLGTRDSGLLRLLNITADHTNHPSIHRGSHDSYADLRRFNRKQSCSLVERASNYCLFLPTVPVLFRPTGGPKIVNTFRTSDPKVLPKPSYSTMSARLFSNRLCSSLLARRPQNVQGFSTRSNFRAADHGDHYDPPTGYLFGIKPGQKYVKEGWENLCYYGFIGSLLVAGVAYIFKPDTSYVLPS